MPWTFLERLYRMWFCFFFLLCLSLTHSFFFFFFRRFSFLEKGLAGIIGQAGATSLGVVVGKTGSLEKIKETKVGGGEGVELLFLYLEVVRLPPSNARESLFRDVAFGFCLAFRLSVVWEPRASHSFVLYFLSFLWFPLFSSM